MGGTQTGSAIQGNQADYMLGTSDGCGSCAGALARRSISATHVCA